MSLTHDEMVAFARVNRPYAAHLVRSMVLAATKGHQEALREVLRGG